MGKKGRGGRPLKFKSVEELQRKIDEYFDYCDKNGKPYTVTGLAVFLDTSRDILIAYEERDEFSNAIKKAKQRIEAYAEEQLFTNRNTAGIIFNMVNNFGWKNRQDVSADIGNKDGKPFEVAHNLRSLSPEELAQLEQLLSRAEKNGEKTS